MKKNILTTLVAALVYFLCIGVGVLLGNLVDHTGNMFYAPAFSALVGGSVYMILLMWLTPQAYIATLVARGKSQDYIDRIMVAHNPGTILLFVASVLIGALLGALIGQKLSKKFADKM